MNTFSDCLDNQSHQWTTQILSDEIWFWHSNACERCVSRGLNFVFSIRFMGCMGGLSQNLSCNSTMRGCIDTGNTRHCTQYITSWPFAHPCRAPAFFSLHMKCDRKQRNCAFRRALHHLTSIRDLFYFLRTDGIIVPSRTWTSSGSLGLVSCSVLWVELVRKWCNSKIQMLFDTCAWKTTTISSWTATRNVKHHRCTWCFLKKLNNRCDFAPLLSDFLE